MKYKTTANIGFTSDGLMCKPGTLCLKPNLT
jgi:hypothetical protein